MRMMEAPSLYELFQLKPARYLNQRSEREFRIVCALLSCQ